MTTSHEYTEALRRVLRLPPMSYGLHDSRSRRALRVALGVLEGGGTPEEAQAAADSSLGLHPYDTGQHLATAGTASHE